MKNTGVMCVVTLPSHVPDEYQQVDMGNYFDHEGQRVLVTSREKAEQYGHLVDVPIYVRRAEGESTEQSADDLVDDLEVSDEVRRQIEWENRQ